MNLLAIETATDVCSVAILRDREIVVSRSLQRARSHAERLVPMIDECLKEVSMRPSSVHIVAVSAGPGSYTGLRIGVSTAKGFVFGTGARLVAVSTLESLAYPLLIEFPGRVVALLPSRRGEHYVAVFESVEQGGVRRLLEESIIHDNQLLSGLQNVGVTSARIAVPEPTGLHQSRDAASMASDSADRPPDGLLEMLETTTTFQLSRVAVSAENVALCAISRVKQQLFEDPSTFEPYYLREFEARQPSGSVFDRLPF